MKPTPNEMLKRYAKDKEHAKSVNRLALMIFDETSKKIYEMPQIEKNYLESAALLHDIGYFIEAKNHNKHSMQMVIQEGLKGFDDRETKIIGCICRYHRGSLPNKEEHEVYKTLDKNDRKIVKRLGGILKLSDGLCKDHLYSFKDIKIEYDNKNSIAKFILIPQSIPPDIRTAIRKRDLFEVGFKCQSVLLMGE